MQITTSLTATATAGMVLALASTTTDVPAALWVAWAALGAIAVAQTVRISREGRA